MLRPADSNACSLEAQIRVVSKLDIASGKLTFMVIYSLPIKNGDLPTKNGIDIFKTQCLYL